MLVHAEFGAGDDGDIGLFKKFLLERDRAFHAEFLERGGDIREAIERVCGSRAAETGHGRIGADTVA